MSTRWNDIAGTLRRRTRRLVSLRGVASVALVAFVLLWTAGFTDWLLHLDTGWVRLLLSLSIVGALSWTVWRTLWRPLSINLSDEDLARTIERRYPVWGDRLSSAAQFRSQQYSDRLGSPALQQVITDDVDSRLDQIDVENVLEPGPTKRLAVIAATIAILGLSGALWQSSAAATALTRLALPFSNVEWPRTTKLRFLDDELHPLKAGPQRTAASEPLALYLENRIGTLPDDATLELRLPDGRTEQRSLQMTVLRDDAGDPHEVGIVTLTAHVGPVEFRAIGGDDVGMPWQTLEVVPAPALASVTITITPPKYIEQPPRTLQGAGAVEALVGSRVRIEGTANTPLASASLRREGHGPKAMPLDNDGRTFVTEFDIEQAGHAWYWFNIADEHGLSPANPPRYELRGIADRKPAVFIDQPGGDVTLTPDARLPLRIIARDDLGLKELWLVHSRADAAPIRVPLGLSTELATDETVEMEWDLAPLELSPGDRLTYFAEGLDAFDLPVVKEPQALEASPQLPASAGAANVPSRSGIGQVGISAYRHIDILTTPEKQQELAARQLGILDTLQDLRQRQSRALESTASLRIQAELADALKPDDLDLLKQTELEQQRIREQLSDEQTGAAGEVEKLRDELARNQIDDPQMAARLDQLSEDLRTLTEDLLPTSEQSLARARKASSTAKGDESETDPQQQLRRAEEAQSKAVAVLGDATSELGGWQRQYEVTSEIDDLIASQTDVQQQTQDIGRETLTKRPESLKPQQQADLARLSDRQRRLASRLEELQKRGSQESSEDAEVDDESARSVSTSMQQALRQLAERDTLSDMHEAAESLKRNDITRTAAAQEEVLKDLREFGEMLHSTQSDDDEELLSKIEQQVEEVETLKKEQETLARQTQQALGPSADPDREQQLERLMKQQDALAQQADELSRQLRRQQNRRSGQSAARAARRMREAQQAIEQQQPAESAESQQEALDDLTQLANELAQRQQEIQQELARQQVERLSEDLQAIADRQDALINATVELDQRQKQRGSWSRSLRKELREATDLQTGLADQLDELQESMGEYPVIELSLVQAADPMRAAAVRMDQTDIDERTVEQQRIAHQRLLAMIDITHPANQPQQQADGQPPSLPNQQGEQGEPSQKLLGTQLRLLRHLQADLQARTAALTERLKDANAGDADIVAERTTLARDQGRIAELTQILLDAFTQQPGELEFPPLNPAEEKP